MNPNVQLSRASYIETVRMYLDRVLEVGRDRYGSRPTPLFVDGLHVDTLEPVRWLCDGETWTISNLANQQNLLRTLNGLSVLTGDNHYKQAAVEALQYVYRHIRYGGLIWWGGHMSYDLQSQRGVYAPDKGMQHEFKCHYPFYEFMYEVNPVETRIFIESLWDCHILNWSNLEFSRHGNLEQASGLSDVWDRKYSGEHVFFTGQGLTFINAGSDLIYAAGMLYHFTGNEKPLVWAKRLAQRYVETRNPKTGLGGYQFSISVLPGVRGDRAIDQFGEQLKQHHPIEATLSVTRQVHTITGQSAICRMTLGERLGDAGKEFIQWTVEDLIAYATHAYDRHDNSFHPILTDGTRLTGLVMEKTGYYGKQGEALPSAQGDLIQLWSYLMGYRLSEEPLLWDVARAIALGNGLGDIGLTAHTDPAMNSKTSCSNPWAIFALLELYKTIGHSAYLETAGTVGDNIVRERFVKGFFIPSENHLYAKLDTLEPLALLHLAGALQGRREELPVYCAGYPFFGSRYDNLGHQKDNQFFYDRKKEI